MCIQALLFHLKEHLQLEALKLGCLHSLAQATTPIPDSVPKFLVHKSGINTFIKRESLRCFHCWFQAEAITCAWVLLIKWRSDLRYLSMCVRLSKVKITLDNLDLMVIFHSVCHGSSAYIYLWQFHPHHRTANSSACTWADFDPLLVLNVWRAWY